MRTGALAAALAVGLVVAGCGQVPVPASPGRPTAPPFDVEVASPDGPVGLVRTGQALELYVGEPDGRTARLTTAPSGHPPTVHLASLGGATGRWSNTFVFGNAPPEARSVVVNGVRGRVDAGLFVVALPIRDLAPDAVAWAFLGQGDVVVIEGHGIRN